jgi:hypothetical protein
MFYRSLTYAKVIKLLFLSSIHWRVITLNMSFVWTRVLFSDTILSFTKLVEGIVGLIKLLNRIYTNANRLIIREFVHCIECEGCIYKSSGVPHIELHLMYSLFLLWEYLQCVAIVRLIWTISEWSTNPEIVRREWDESLSHLRVR